jgi:hypothetical protein
MKTFLKCLALLLLVCLSVWAIRSDAAEGQAGAGAAAPAAAPAAPAGDAGWRRAALWDDGTAEFCAYEVTWARYGHRFPGRALLVLVKEPWAPDLDVKADSPRRDGFDVLKLNHQREVQTGIYSYDQMASVFVRRDSGALVKLAANSSEACGVSNAQVRDGRLTTRSYFDGEGERSAAYPAGALPEDGLPVSLRDWVAAAPPATLAVFPSLMASRFPALEPVEYRVEKSAREDGVEIRLTRGSAFLAYTFEKEAPHRLRRFEREDGTVYRLAKCERLPYWQMHEPGDEGWWPEGLR